MPHRAGRLEQHVRLQKEQTEDAYRKGGDRRPGGDHAGQGAQVLGRAPIKILASPQYTLAQHKTDIK